MRTTTIEQRNEIYRQAVTLKEYGFVCCRIGKIFNKDIDTFKLSEGVDETTFPELFLFRDSSFYCWLDSHDEQVNDSLLRNIVLDFCIEMTNTK